MKFITSAFKKNLYVLDCSQIYRNDLDNKLINCINLNNVFLRTNTLFENKKGKL